MTETVYGVKPAGHDAQRVRSYAQPSQELREFALEWLKTARTDVEVKQYPVEQINSLFVDPVVNAHQNADALGRLIEQLYRKVDPPVIWLDFAPTQYVSIRLPEEFVLVNYHIRNAGEFSNLSYVDVGVLFEFGQLGVKPNSSLTVEEKKFVRRKGTNMLWSRLEVCCEQGRTEVTMKSSESVYTGLQSHQHTLSLRPGLQEHFSGLVTCAKNTPHELHAKYGDGKRIIETIDSYVSVR